MGPQKPTRTLLLPVLNVSNHDSSYCSNWEDIVAPNSIVIVEDEEAPNDVVAAPKIEELVAPDAGAGEEEKAKENFLHPSFVFLYKLQILLEYLQVQCRASLQAKAFHHDMVVAIKDAMVCSSKALNWQG